MKIAVYAIAKNEQANVKRWASSAREADLMLIGDTGSSDRTVAVARDLGVQVINANVNPWRFDTARNLVLDTIPLDFDYCVALDLDEVLLPGWRDGIEEAARLGSNKPAYKFVHTWNDDGTEHFSYLAHKVHTRRDFEWRLPIHEALYPRDGVEEVRAFVDDLEIHHLSDDIEKEHRSNPTDILEIAVNEDPHNVCVLYFLARQYYRDHDYEKAIPLLKRWLDLAGAENEPDTERVFRMLAHADEEHRENWLLVGCRWCPGKREAWAALGEYYFFFSDNMQKCIEAFDRAFEIEGTYPMGWEKEEFAWGRMPYEMALEASARIKDTSRMERYKHILETEYGALCGT